jgi:hypothetical protein
MDERPEPHHGDRPHGANRTTTPYSRRLVASSVRLLEIQYCLWERDLRDPEQPLTEYGFRLSAYPAGLAGHACRYDALEGQATILLGDMILHGRTDGNAVAIHRRTLGISTARIHTWSSVARLVRGAPTEANTLVPRLISWIGGYEQWMLDSRGEDARSALVGSFGLERDLPALWWSLASEWRAALSEAPLSN